MEYEIINRKPFTTDQVAGNTKGYFMETITSWADLNGKSNSDTIYSITNMNDTKESYSYTDMNGVGMDERRHFSLDDMNGFCTF